MSVLACIDRSRYSESVCDHAAWAAGRLQTSVELLHAIEHHPDLLPVDHRGRLGMDTGEELLRELSLIDDQRNRLAQESGRQLLDEAARRVHEAGGVKVTQRLGHGDLTDNLRDHHARARMVTIGKRGESHERATAPLGGNLERVIRANRLPVLIAAEAFRPVERFLFAYDGGKSTGEAVNFLVRNELLHQARGHVLMVGRGGGVEATRQADAVRHLRSAGLEVTDAIIEGEPAQAIGDAVTGGDWDLLVMGAYGHSRIRRFMIGSTTTEVMQTCPTSMLVFH